MSKNEFRIVYNERDGLFRAQRKGWIFWNDCWWHMDPMMSFPIKYSSLEEAEFAIAKYKERRAKSRSWKTVKEIDGSM